MRSSIMLLSILLLVGCGSAIETVKLSRTQNILVQTPLADGAKCTLTDATGRKWKVRSTPGNVAVADGHSPLQVICTKDGYKNTVETVKEFKEELLTIDGKRVTMNAYDQFPTKAPRLIPTAIKEASSFVIDPTGNISTKYPNEITIWMEPNTWESEKAMREWAYEKSVWQNESIIVAEEDKAKDDERKVVRREKKDARAESRKKLYAKAKVFGEKAIDANTYVGYAKKGTKWGVDSADKIVEGAVDVTGIVAEGAANTAGNVSDKVAPRDAMEQVGKRVDSLMGKKSEPKIEMEEEQEETVHGEENSVPATSVKGALSPLK
jgi:hypothetical protein